MINTIPAASAGSLPPRPTPIPSITPVARTGVSGAPIELQVPGAHSAWWTVVQWQDARGNWNIVTGWQGSFDEIKSGTGYKTWWVAPADLGKGPFRWAVYETKDGALVKASEPFNLPAVRKVRTIVTVTAK